MPSGCNPSTSGSCFYFSAQPQSVQTVSIYIFELSGISPGYIAVTLSPNASPGNNESTYICANNKGKVKFFSALLQSDGTLVKQQLSVNSVKGSVDGDKIQCTFMATVPASATRASATPLSVQVFTGTYNSDNENLGPANSQLSTTPVDLSNPSATVTYSNSTIASPTASTTASTTANTTASSTAAHNYAIALQQSLMQALLISVTMLELAML
uniref:uncharacterized protein LOC109953818 n=1 Tax=Monopterus albus TaxID=43700 RepID=UPI0009B33F45|nr:uncharacterized protein LOC109953818 [Monopterus albus]